MTQTANPMAGRRDFPPELEELGWRIKQTRQGLGISRAEFAAQLNIDSCQVGKIERGRRDLSTLLLCRIAAVLRTDVETLVRGIPSGDGSYERPTINAPGDEADSSTSDERPIQPATIKQFRKKHQLSQHALGRLCGVSQGTVFRWESGIGPISDGSSILLRELLEGRRNLTPLTAAEEHLLNEIVSMGRYASRETFLTTTFMELLKQRSLGADSQLNAPDPQISIDPPP